MSQSFRVLLVEDDDSLRVCLDEFLVSYGWSVTATAFGKEAIHLARRHRFDFSILDFHLPETTGLEVFRAIAVTRPLPAILMSGLATADEAAQARQAGVFTFLRKPLDLERLRRAVQMLIQHHFGGPLVPGIGPSTSQPSIGKPLSGQPLSGQPLSGQPPFGPSGFFPRRPRSGPRPPQGPG